MGTFITLDPLAELVIVDVAVTPIRESKNQMDIALSGVTPANNVTGPVTGGRMNPAYRIPPVEAGIVKLAEYVLNTFDAVPAKLAVGKYEAVRADGSAKDVSNS